MTTIYRSPAGMRTIRAWCEARLADWDLPHRTLTVATARGPTHVVTAGEGPDLVLLPGTNFSAATWLDLIGSFAGHYTVHALDLPGQPGLSAAERPSRAAERHGPWLAEVMAMLGSTRPLVVAHSLGAVPALRAAADGLNVRRLVLVDPAGVMRLRVSMAVMRPTMPWLLWPNATTSARLLTMMMAAGHRPEPGLVTWMSLVGEHVRTSLAPSALPDHVLRDVRDLPIDVLSGEQDAFLPPARLQRALGRRLPTSSLHITPGAGHMLPHERPDTLLDHLGVLETR